MITSDELAFVRQAMRDRILSANVVKEAIERKKWDAPDRPISSILVDMGALRSDDALRLRKAVDEGGAAEGGPKKIRATTPGKDPNARESDQGATAGLPEKIGPYQVLRLLGAGAMGAVYHAKHVELQRDVALKLLQSEGAPTARAIQRFKREARLAARLDHPNIVRVHEAGQDGQHHYIAMDMVRGRSVAELITLNEITVRRATHIMKKVADAVAYANEQGVIHRDLKPANILVDERTGEPRVTDFGLAVLADPDEDDKLTRTGAAVGTPAYMAPEQVRGKLDEIDRRTDVYALGATFYEMLTGSPPFDAPTFLELAKKICDVDPIPPRRRNPQVPQDVETVCLKALEKDKAARYPTAAEMSKDLWAFLDDAPIVARPPSALERAHRWMKRNRTLSAALAGVGAVFAAAAGYWLSLPGTLVIATSPHGAVVLIDGEEVKDERGQPLLTPEQGALAVPVPAGTHRVRFRLKGYLERAVGDDEVRVGHGEEKPVGGTLVTTKGLLRVETDPPGAPVTVEPIIGGAALSRGTTPFLASLEAGRYRVVLGAPGGHLPPRPEEVVIESGGNETPVSLRLVRDSAEVLVESDPDGAAVRWSRDPAPRIAPAVLPGAGEHEVLVSKPGFLPRRLKVDVQKGGKVGWRATLVPLVAWRRDLEGRLLDGPLVRDVDADGAPDLIVLEDTLEGVRLTLLPGAGHAGARWRVPTQARSLVDAEDVDGDGVLDVVCGGPRHLELHDGGSGRLLAQATGLDAGAVAIHRPARGPAQLVTLEAGDRPRAQPLTLALAGASGSPAAGPRGRPAVVVLGARSFTPKPVAAFPAQGAVLLWGLEGSARPVPVPGATPTSPIVPVVLERNAAEPFLVVVPERGPARLIDPQAGKAQPVGEESGELRLRAPAFLLADKPWLLLEDARAGTTLAFELTAGGARRAPVAPCGGGAVVLRTGTEPAGPGGLAGPAAWTARGEVLVPGTDGWRVDEEASTDPEQWVARGRAPVVADADGDGAPELLLPSPDGRSIVALDPSPGRIRWRRSAPRPAAVALGAVDEVAGDDLLLALGDRVVGLSLDDGRQVLERAAGGRVVALAAAPPAAAGLRSVLYHGVETSPVARAVTRLAHSPSKGWYDDWSQARPVNGLASLPLDLDADGVADLLAGGPLALLQAKDGVEAWAERPGGAPDLLGTAAPLWAPGAVALCLGVRDPPREQDPPLLVAHDPRGQLLWEQPLDARPQGAPRALPDPPRQLLALDTEPYVVVVTGRRLLAVQRTDGGPRWATSLPDVAGAVLVPGSPPRLVATTEAGEVRCLDAATGATLWLRRLPPGRPGATASAPVVILPPQQPADATRPAVAAVAAAAPSGVLVLLALDDGAWLGERRSPDSPFAPFLVTAPGGLLVLATEDQRLVALPIGAPVRPAWGWRERVAEQVRRLELVEEPVRSRRAGADLVRPILDALGALEREDPADPTAQLALARARALVGEHEAALEAAEKVLKARPRSPDALRIKAAARWAKAQRFADAQEPLEALSRIDPGLAATSAVELAAGSDEVGRFLRTLRARAPLDPTVQRVLGGEVLRSLPRRTSLQWASVSRDDLFEARQTAAEARGSLVYSLLRADAADARAEALLAVVVERRMTAYVAKRAKSEREKERLQVLQELAQDLAARSAPTAAGDALRVLELVQLLAASGDEQEAPLMALEELRGLRPAWEGPLNLLRGLRP